MLTSCLRNEENVWRSRLIRLLASVLALQLPASKLPFSRPLSTPPPTPQKGLGAVRRVGEGGGPYQVPVGPQLARRPEVLAGPGALSESLPPRHRLREASRALRRKMSPPAWGSFRTPKSGRSLGMRTVPEAMVHRNCRRMSKPRVPRHGPGRRRCLSPGEASGKLTENRREEEDRQYDA